MPDDDINNPGSRRRQRNPREQNPLKQLRSLLFRKKLRQPVKLTEDHILSVLYVRDARNEILGKHLFSDPAWDILLELYAARLGGRSMSLQELVQAVEAPRSTVERWLTALERAGLTTTSADPAEATRIQIILTAEGASKMERLANHWGTAFLSV
ncbi:MAG TPA: helix-turn-helix domain-containing protein [Bryobacterales bacterium]|nr:helix-turn-helix domain-containing protein [Bryobacterales bacterium]